MPRGAVGVVSRVNIRLAATRRKSRLPAAHKAVADSDRNSAAHSRIKPLAVSLLTDSPFPF